MIVTILGSGHAIPTARRAQSGYLVEWAGGALLIDPSAGTYAQAIKAGLDPTLLRALAITHDHLDHTGDVPVIARARRQAELAPAPVIESYPYSRDGLTVAAFPAVHKVAAVCLRIEAEGKVLAYSGDTEDCDGLREACRGADLALLECTFNEPRPGHLTPSDCATIASETGAQRVLLTHLGPGIETDLPMAEDGQVVTL